MLKVWTTAFVLAGHSVFAQQGDALSQARDAISLFEAAQIRLDAAQSATDRSKALTSVIKAYEEGLDAVRASLRNLALLEAEISQDFDVESDEVSDLLGVLIGLKADASPEALVHPTGPVGHARAGMLLSSATPELQAEVDVLKNKLSGVVELKQLQNETMKTLSEGLFDVQTARTSLSQAISDRVDLPRRFVTDPARMQTLLESADSIESFATSLAVMDVVDGVPSLPSILDNKGNWPLPVSGQLLRGFAETDASGVERPGWLLATRPLSIVTSPWPSTIRYLGPFLDYGNVIILEPGNDVLIVLAGLDEVYGETGEVISAGAAVGLMGGDVPQLDDFVENASIGTGASLSETLYIEVREGGLPVDPQLWFEK